MMIEFDIDGQDIKAEAEAAEEPLLSPAEPIGIAEVLEDDIGGVRAVRVLEMRRPATRPAGCGGVAISVLNLFSCCSAPVLHGIQSASSTTRLVGMQSATLAGAMFCRRSARCRHCRSHFHISLQGEVNLNEVRNSSGCDAQLLHAQ
jgi:hypothetical protein